MTVGITELPPEGMQLPGVALAGDAERGTKTTEGISLLFTSAGVTVQGPQPQIERLLVWTALDSATCREKMELPDGREAAIMELTSGGQSIRFLLPSDSVSPGQAAYLDQALPTWLVRYKGSVAPIASDQVAPAPIAPGGEAEVGVALPAPGPHPVTAETSLQDATDTPAPAFAAAPAAGAVLGAAGLVADQPTGASGPNGTGMVTDVPLTTPPVMQAPVAPVMQAPPPPAPSAPVMAPPAGQVPPPPSPTMQAPPPPSPTMQAPPAPPVVQAPAPAPATAWDDPPLGSGTPVATPVEAKKAKKPKFALTRKQLHAAEAAAAGTAVAGAADGASTAAPDAVVQAPTFEATKAKKPKFALTRKQLHAAEAAAAGTPVAGAAAAGAPSVDQQFAGPMSAPAPAPAPAPAATKAKKPKFALTRKQLHAAEAAAAGTAVAGAVMAATEAPPVAHPTDPVPLAVQPPPPVAQRDPAASLWQPTPPSGGLPPGDGSGHGSGGGAGDPGAGSPVLADVGSKPNRRNLILVVGLLVVAVSVGGYLIMKKDNSNTTAPSPAPISAAVADTALAASINLRLADLPSGWTQVSSTQAVVRLPVAPAAAQASAGNAMASCLNTSYAVVSGLFASGSLIGQTSLVQSPTFASAGGPSFEMASRTATMTSPGQVRALDAVFTGPKFDACFQGYQTALAQAAVPGATVQTQSVSLPAPAGVTAYGMVSTYTVPGIGTAVVGDAYLLGGRAYTVIQPSTNGPPIPSEVFAPAYRAVAGRLAASGSK